MAAVAAAGAGSCGGGGGAAADTTAAARQAAATHTPSFSTPRQNVQRVASELQHAASGRNRRFGRRRRRMPGPTARPLRRATGRASASGPELPTRPIGTTALTPAIVRTSTIVRILANRAQLRRQTVRTSATTSTSTTATNNFVRPTHADWNRGDWYHGDWHGNWNNAWYHRPVGWWAAGYWAGAALSAIPWSWGYWPYYNPYYAAPVVDGSATIDYSQPIVVAQAAASPPVAQAGLTAEQQATPLLDAARNAFMQGDYKTALAQVDQAIAQVPNDTVLHEFRGLALFALGRYKEAAAADYAVLSAGPGWDWTTLSGLYPNVDVYTEQLRALEQYAKSHPAASEARFLLAEHYLTCGYTDAAAAQFKEVVQLNPKDQLSAQLLNSISAADTRRAGGAEPTGGGGEPVDASSLVGNWTATRADSATIKLALAGDGKFTWALDQNGKPQQFSGTYTVADNLLVLKQGNNPMMVGQVASLAGDRFNFKLAGDNPSDPGLTFVR